MSTFVFDITYWLGVLTGACAMGIVWSSCTLFEILRSKK